MLDPKPKTLTVNPQPLNPLYICVENLSMISESEKHQVWQGNLDEFQFLT